MDKDPTTVVDNPSDDAASTTVTDPKSTTGDQTANNGDNLEPSKSTDTSAAGDDKTKTQTGKTDDTPASKFDDDIDDWISKRGLPAAADDSQKQKYQDLRNEQREFTRDREAAKTAENANNLGTAVKDAKTEVAADEDEDDELDPLEKRMADLEAAREADRVSYQQESFYMTNKVTDEQHKAILDLYKEKTSRPTTLEGKKAAVDFWSSPEALPDLLEQAKARLVLAQDPKAVQDEAARLEREKIERESHASSPSRSATVTKTDSKTTDEARTEALKARYSSK